MHLRTTVWPTWLGAAAMVSVLWGCRHENPSDGAPAHTTEAAQVADPDTHEEPIAPACELERQRFVLVNGRWQAECLDTPIPRTSSIWTSDGHRVAVLVNEKCKDTEEQKVFVIEKDAVKQVPLRVERRVGRGGAIAFQGDGMIVVRGESCGVWGPGLQIYRLVLNSGVVTRYQHFSKMLKLWPSLAVNEVGVDIPLSFSDAFGFVEGTSAELGVVYGCTQFWPVRKEDPGCHAASAYFPNDDTDGAMTWGSIGGHIRDEKGPTYPIGRGISWAQDPSKGSMVYVGGIDAPEFGQLNDFVLTPFTWALHQYRASRRLPNPPVMGDGVQLVFDSDRKQMVLLDPASTRSWILEDNRRWASFEHDPLRPLAEQLGQLEHVSAAAETQAPRIPATRAEFDNLPPPIWRNTDHVAPWFAAYDLDRHAIVLYPYLPEAVFCLPVRDKPGETVCLSSHS